MVKQWKLDKVNEIAERLGKYKSIMVISLKNIPGKQLLHIRHSIKNKAGVIMVKKCIIKRALEKVGMKEMAQEVGDVPALLVSNYDPFSLSIILDKEKVPAYAKAGETAPKDIIVPKGATQFPPGPILSELSDAGIKVKIEGGKIAVTKETVVAEKGSTINANQAGILKKLDIMPMKIGLNIILAFADKKLFRNIHVDIETIKNNLRISRMQAINLAVNSGTIIPETAELLLSKAENEAINLAIESNILTEKTTGIILGKAHYVASSLLGV